MTSSEPVPNGTPSAAGKLTDDESIAAVQAALGTEHAAAWAYRLTTAFISDTGGDLDAGEIAHRAQRDLAERLLRDAGATPQAAQAAYVAGGQVNDQASAVRLLVTAEDDVATAWRGVLERTDNAALRRTGLDALTGAAVRATRWRHVAGEVPASRALPGSGT